MMASMYPGDNHALFYKHGQQTFDARSLPGIVKSEPMDDVTGTDRPVDMSLPPRMDTSPTNTKNNVGSNGRNSLSPRHRPMAGSSDTASLNVDIPTSARHHYYPNGPYMHSGSQHQHSSLSPHHPSTLPLPHHSHRPRSSTTGGSAAHMSPSKYSSGLIPHTHSYESRASTSPTFVRTVSPGMRSTSPTYAMKSSDGKLTVPSVMKNDEGGQVFRDVDLLPVLSHQRAKREFVPEDKKDQGYWCKRIKNNDSARRSRMKRKALEKMMESRLLELQKENIELKHEMQALKRRFGIAQDDSGCSSGSGESKESSPCEMSDNETSGDNSRDRDNHSNNSSDSGKDSRPQPLIVQEDMDAQGSGSSDDSRYNDDSRVYTGLPHLLEPTGRDRADSIGSSSSLMGSSSVGPSPGGAPSRSYPGRNTLQPDSRGSHANSGLHLGAAMQMDKLGALDLTSDHSNRSTPARDSSSPESCGSQSGGNTSSSIGSCASDRRFSCLSSDGSSLEESSSSGSNSSSAVSSEMKTFPLKCRWKKCVQSSTMNSSDV